MYRTMELQKCLKKTILLSLFILGLKICCINSADLEAPYINPAVSTLDVDSGSNLSLACNGSAPVTWRHDLHEGLDRLSIVETNYTTPQRYVSRLNIINVSYVDLGNYECHYSDPKYEEIAGGAYIYIFVFDNEKLLAKESENVAAITAVKGSAKTFDICKPTSHNVQVTLTHDNKIIEPGPNTTVTYDDRKGFTIDPVVTKSAGVYGCIGKRGNKIQQIHFFFFVEDGPPFISNPTIDTALAKAVSVGGTFSLDCLADTPSNTFFSLEWVAPESVNKTGRVILEPLVDLSTQTRKKFRLRLTVVNATKEDAKNPFECRIQSRNVNKSSLQFIKIFGPGDEYLHVNASKDGNITVNASGEARWVVEVHGFPIPNEFSWKSPKGNEIGNSLTKYKKIAESKLNQVILTISDVTMADGGMYKFTAGNDLDRHHTIDLFLTVRDSPEVTILRTNSTNKPYFRVGKQYTFRCRATGFPYPNIQWSFQECEEADLSKCDDYFKVLSTTGKPIRNIHDNAPRQTWMEVVLNVTKSGHLKCSANNSIGEEEDIKDIIGIDFSNNLGDGFVADGLANPIEKDDVRYLCAVTKVNSTDNNRWYYRNFSGDLTRRIPAEEIKGVTVTDTSTIWSYQRTLRINEVHFRHNGEYICEVEFPDRENPIADKSIMLNVRKQQKPEITETNLNGTTIVVRPGDKVDPLYCNATGVPTPFILWYKDDVISTDWPSREHIYILNGQVVLGFLKSEHSGQYKCVAKNRVGQDDRIINIDVKEPLTWFTIIFVICSVIILLVLGLCLFQKIRRERKMKLFLRKLDLQDFENGDIEKINPEQDIESQVNLLPYDKKYEFPRERLKLGVQLGSGAFGRVVRAEATGITEGESMSIVAVKMVKPNADESHFKALMSELKIMIHLGQHVNVVNLLGACTKQLMKKRELLVIVEYCKYGSLLTYLHRHRNDFIDQLDRVRDVVDPNICYPLERPNTGNRLNYAALTFSDGGAATASRTTASGYHTMDQISFDQNNGFQMPSTSTSENATSPLPEDYVLSAHLQSVCTDMSYVSNSPAVQMTDGKRRSSGSSSWNGNYRGIYQYRDVQPITTTDLLCWSFQISRGMEYLSSRKILHGDLAARNVLLADHNVVKICDFGLAREMYQEEYKKRSEGVLLPVKWMAIESICLGVFSTQSDVWSFGVVMWELFTLGKTPYPGMDADEKFYKMLNDGYRMEKPAYSPSSTYDLMSDCWNHEPSARPSFTALTDRIGDLMEEGQRQHYIDLNCPYTTMNERRMEGREDYLLKMSGPDFSTVSRRGTPDRSYANMPENLRPGLSSDCLVPNNLAVPPMQYVVNESYQNLTIPSAEDKRLHSLANNTGYLYMNKNLSDSPGPLGIFSPRPENPNTSGGNTSEFNFNNVDCPSTSTVAKTDESSNLVTSSSFSPKEVQGISNMHYLPNTIFSPADTREMQDILLEAAKASYNVQTIGQLKEPKKRQKNDSGISSIDSNYEGNTKAASPLPPYANSFNGVGCTDSSHHQSQNHVVNFQTPPTIIAGGHSE